MISRSAIFVSVIAWLAAACADSPPLAAPVRKAALSSALQPDVGNGGLLGTFTLAPPSNSVDGMPQTATPITLPSGVAVRVTVRGKMDFTRNPAWLTCFGMVYPPLSLMSVGPWGFPPAGDFGVNVGAGDATGIQPGAFRSLSPADGTSDTAGVDLVGSGGVLWVRRSGVSETCGPNTPAYLVSGSQTLTAIAVAMGKDSTLKLQLGVTPPAVDPVITQRFDAVTQVATFRDGSNAPRSDFTTLHLHAFWDPSGHPASQAQVTLFSEPVPGSGAHDHTAGRPAGTFFRLGDDLSMPAGGARGQVSLTLPESGDTTLLYRSSGVGGTEHIRAEAMAGGKQARDTGSVIVRLPYPLDLIAGSGVSYQFVPSQLHSSGDFFLVPGAIDAMAALWSDFIANVTAGTARYSMNGSIFFLTAASLEQGGLYDITGGWHVPGHYLHRRGTDVDFADRNALSTTSAEHDPQLMAQHCRKFSFVGYRIKCELHKGTHYHAYLAPEPR